MSKLNLYAVLSGKQVTVKCEGQTYHVVMDEEKEADALYSKAIKAKASGDEKTIRSFVNTLKPDYKEVIMDGQIRRSRSGQFFLADYNLPIPMDIVRKMKEFHKKNFPLTPLIQFTRQLLLNPDKHVRESLFKFAERFKFPITDNGYFIAYKSVAWKGEQKRSFGISIVNHYTSKKAAGRSTDGIIVYSTGPENNMTPIFLTDDEVVEFLDEQIHNYNFNAHEEFCPEDYVVKNCFKEWTAFQSKLKGITGKKAYNLILEFAEEMGFEAPDKTEFWMKQMNWQEHGELEEVFHNLSLMFEHEVPTFTDWRTQSMTIKLGEPVVMDRKKCDNDPSRTCSSGLHVGAPGYVSGFRRGDQNYIIACLVNPMNVVAIPDDYDFEKMRCCEYFPYAISELNEDNGQLEEIETQYFEEDYTTFEKETLEGMLKELSKEEGVADADIDGDTNTLCEVKKVIKSRLVELG